jgi:hypothetical protein
LAFCARTVALQEHLSNEMILSGSGYVVLRLWFYNDQAGMHFDKISFDLEVIFVMMEYCSQFSSDFEITSSLIIPSHHCLFLLEQLLY